MAGQKEAIEWVGKLKLHNAVQLMPFLSQEQLWDQFLRADVMVSVSVHDGMPNSVLEAMACGCFPVVGDIESLREWITPGVNGLLVEPTKPQSLADALVLALENPVLRTEAAAINRDLIARRAGVNVVRARVDAFYRRFL
jgi:glycosyltransferase involved in cell wall biosynthesis